MTLAAEIKRLRQQYGSHDKLAKALGTSRNTVIRWEQGGFPRDYVDKLKELGVPAELLRPPSQPRLQELQETVETLKAGQAVAQETIEELIRRVEALEDQARGLVRTRRPNPPKAARP